MSSPIPPMTMKISAQNEALKELEKARAEIVRLTDTARRNFGQGFPRATQASTEGLGKLRAGVQAVAFQAAGIEGPIGRLSSGLLTFAAGSTLVLGVTAGVGAIATAYKLASREVRELTEANEKAQKSFRDLTIAAHPELGARFAAREQVAAIETQREAARAQLQQAVNPPLIASKGGAFRAPIDQAVVTEIETLISSLTLSLKAARDQAAEVLAGPGKDFLTQLEHERDLVGATAQRAAELRAEWAKLAPTEIERAGRLAAEIEARREVVRLMEAQAELLLEFDRIQAGIRLPTLEELAGISTGIPKLADPAITERAKQEASVGFFKDAGKDIAGVRAFERALHASAEAAALAARAHQRGAISIIQSASGLIAGLVGGGGAGGFLGGLGGLVSDLPGGGLAGAVLGGLGSIVGAGEGPARVTIDGYTQNALDQQRRQEENKRNVIILQLVDAHGNVRDQIYDVARYQNRGGTAGGITARSDGGAVTTRSG